MTEVEHPEIAAEVAASCKDLPSTAALLEERKSHIGYNVALNYSKLPLYIVRGHQQYLYDVEGHEYLDGVNNVCHVGHCHPHVVAAACEQIAHLNTNSRYLSPYILEYITRLKRTFHTEPNPYRPAGHKKALSVAFWVNSGSEANDLALRLARCHTGKRGVITVDGAYHGHLTSIIDISPYKYARSGGQGRRNWVRCAPVPDVFSGKYRGGLEEDHLGAAYAADVQRLIDSFSRAERREAERKTAWLRKKAEKAARAGGEGAAAGPDASSDALAEQEDSDDDYDDDGLTGGCGAFIMESVLSCGGQVMPPTGYLRRVYAAVRAAGGVCIADEVQVGFGRVGEKFWAYQLQGWDVMPDILTLGKPLGDGFPVAMVVTTPEIAASFNNGMEYFNTFGGNPVAGRVALAVLDVIEKEKLQENAVRVGKVLLAGFHALQAKYNIIGSVRGIGMMVGIEILRDNRSALREPWAEAASAIVYAMRKRRILLSTDGMANNVIKMKPPMVFSEANAHRVIRELSDVFAHFEEHLADYQSM